MATRLYRAVMRKHRESAIPGQSIELTSFYNNYMRWIEQGSPSHPIFKKYYGLCGNVRRFAVMRGDKLQEEMKGQFIKAGLHECYPFNKDGNSYHEECLFHHTTSNQERLQWVLDHTIGELS